MVKLVQLGSLYAREEKQLSRSEQHEILVYAKRCLPLFLAQIRRLVSAVKHCTASVTLGLRQELASHFVPELEALADVINELGLDVKDILEVVIAREQAEMDADSMRKKSLESVRLRIHLIA